MSPRHRVRIITTGLPNSTILIVPDSGFRAIDVWSSPLGIPDLGNGRQARTSDHPLSGGRVAKPDEVSGPVVNHLATGIFSRHAFGGCVNMQIELRETSKPDTIGKRESDFFSTLTVRRIDSLFPTIIAEQSLLRCLRWAVLPPNSGSLPSSK